MANRSDIIIKNKEEKTHMLTDLATPPYLNIMQKEAEEKLTRRMWYMKYIIIPVVTGATGIVTKCLKKGSKPFQENIQQIHYKRQLYLDYYT
jgi:hypothetical protein